MNASEDEDVFYDYDFNLSGDDMLFYDYVDANVAFGGSKSDDDFDSTYGFDDEGKMKYQMYNPRAENKNPDLKLGLIFSSKEDAKFAIQSHCLRRGMMMNFEKNDKKRLKAVCKKEGCTWFVYASKMQNDNTWQIKSYNPEARGLGITKDTTLKANVSKWQAYRAKKKEKVGRPQRLRRREPDEPLAPTANPFSLFSLCLPLTLNGISMSQRNAHRSKDLTLGVGLRICLGAMKPTLEGVLRLVGMIGIHGSDSMGLVVGLEESWQSRAYEDCILDMARGGCAIGHGHHKLYPVQSEYVARIVDSKKESVPYQYCDREISYAL
ncbi:UNVERIFIED_CONTAM: hypothetical protein Scaly_2648500 [Sesamum calycinum]|uniref:Transposase MuDR plant domain-containing protein n=1 Tax=Sesamum calycinum TaxID=2727403 RepID=A0AAW2J9G8_9LAMI